MIKHLKPRSKWEILFNQIKSFSIKRKIVKWQHDRYVKKLSKSWETNASLELSKEIDKDILKKLFEYVNEV